MTTRKILNLMRSLSDQKAHTNSDILLTGFMQTYGVKDEVFAAAFLSGNERHIPKKRIDVRSRKLNIEEAISAFRSAWNGIDAYPASKAEFERRRTEERDAVREQEEKIIDSTRASLIDFANAALAGNLALKPKWDSIAKTLVVPVPRELTEAKREAFLVWFLQSELSLSAADGKVVLTTLREQRKVRENTLRMVRESEKAEREKRKLAAQVARTQQEAEKQLIPAYLVPELLEISKTEFDRWRGEGRIPVAGERAFRKWGRTLTTTVHPANLRELITQEMIDSWRGDHQHDLQTKRAQAAEKGKRTRAANDVIRQSADLAWDEMYGAWVASYGETHANLLALAFWTQFASRWAKYHESLGNKSGRRHQARQDWYDKKDAALRVLARTPLAEVSFVPSDEAPWTELRVQFCEDHLEEFREGRGLMWEDARDFIDDRARELKRCPRCECSHIDHTNDAALYFISVRSPDEQVRFGFHVPYRKGSAFLPEPKVLPRAEHADEQKTQDSQFRFGRPVLESEAIPFSEARTERSIEGFLSAVLHLDFQ